MIRYGTPSQRLRMSTQYSDFECDIRVQDTMFRKLQLAELDCSMHAAGWQDKVWYGHDSTVGEPCTVVPTT